MKSIESSLKESESHVQEAHALQRHTDRMAHEIDNITKTVSSAEVCLWGGYQLDALGMVHKVVSRSPFGW